MDNGFIKVAAASPKIKVADVKFNAGSIADCICSAANHGAKIIVLPELCLTAYTCGDLFLQDRLIKNAEEALLWIAEKTKDKDILAAVGTPLLVGNSLYNAAAIIKSGEILGFVTKSHLPNYSEFYERRHFNTMDSNTVITFGGKKVPVGSRLLFCADNVPALTVGCEICEDLWVTNSPSAQHALAGATVMLNLSASDEIVGKKEFRRLLVKAQSAKAICAYIYADAGCGESTTDMVFAGHNMIYENGTPLAETKPFEDKILYSEIDIQKLSLERRKISTFEESDDERYIRIPFTLEKCSTALTRFVDPLPFVPKDKTELTRRCEEIFALQYMSLAKRLEHIGTKTVTIGISGGLDSTLALLVAVRAFDYLNLDRDGIIAVTMPCFGTTSRTRGNAEKMIDALGAQFREVKIAESVRMHFKDLDISEDEHDVTYENAQARERTQVLMDISNKTGGIVIGTGDLSELALGFATYNGDHMSMYGVNASIPKTLVKHLVKYVADNSEAELKSVLYDVLNTPVSPELLPPEEDGNIAQRTEEIVGPYELHDFFLYHTVRNGFDKDKIRALCEYAFEGRYSADTIEKWLSIFYRRFFNNQFKRSCLPDGPKIGSVALSPRGDWRMPSDAVNFYK